MRLAYCIMALLLISNVTLDRAGGEEFHYEKPILLDLAATEDVVAVQLDSDVYGSTRDSFPDVRVLTESGVETPFVIKRAIGKRTQSSRESIRSKVDSLTEKENRIEILASIVEKSSSPEGLTINTQLKDFRKSIDVVGSTDGETWKPLVQDALIFDYTRYMDLRNLEVRLPANQFRVFRITVKETSEKQELAFTELTKRYRKGIEVELIEKTQLQRKTLRIERLEFWHFDKRQVSAGDITTAYPVSDFQVEEQSETKETVVNIWMQRQPLIAFELDTTSRNFSRAATAQVRVSTDRGTSWNTIGNATLLNLDLLGTKRSQSRLSFSETRNLEFRLVIKNGDSPPIEVTGLTATGQVYRAVFLASKGVSYKLLYGSESAKAPAYDVVSVLSAMKPGYSVKEGTLGEQKVISPVSAPSFSVRSLLNNPIFLGVIVVVLVAVFAVVLFRAARSVESLPEE